MSKYDVIQALINHAGIEENLILFDVKINERVIDTPIAKLNGFEIKTIEYNPKDICLLDYDDKYLYLMYECGCKKIEFEKIHKIRFE